MELVLGASTAAMKSLAGNLGHLLSEEYANIGRIHDDAQYIADELEAMQAFVLDLDATAMESHDHRTQNWLRKIRDIAFDIEDCMCEYRPHAVIKDSISCSIMDLRTYQLRTWRLRRQLASRIAKIKLQVQRIAERRYRYEVNKPIICCSGIHAAAAEQHHLVAHNIDENQVVTRQLIGMEIEPVGVMTEMKMLQEWVARPCEETAVLSIIGFGGVGKTTIATALYRKVGNDFDCRASVNLSQNHDQDAVLRSILNQIMPEDNGDHKQQNSSTGISSDDKKLASQIGKTLKRLASPIQTCWQHGEDGTSDVNHYQYAQELKEQLTRKRYLLLIDDIWSTTTWQKIKKCLPENNKGNRIIVTSRFRAVGALCSQKRSTDFLHNIRDLNRHDSKLLFDRNFVESISSRERERVPDHVLDLVLEKICIGVPLSIVTMAGHVACNWNEMSRDWFEAIKSLSLDPVISHYSPDGVKRIIDFSYNYLSGELKACALCLSIFPKGFKISRKRFIRRLIAERFVSGTEEQTTEEIAEIYVNELIRRKIICPVDHNSNGEVKNFDVHDMVLQFFVIKSVKENCVNIVGGQWTIPVNINRVRRLSMQRGGPKHGRSTEGVDLSRVRSLTIFGSLNQLPLHSFNHLIVQLLDLEGCQGLKYKHLNEICKMLSLKYLSLRRTEITEIPSKIGNLIELETLDIRETNVKVLPKSVCHLKRICNILGGTKNNPRKGLRLPQEISKDGMEALRVLSGIQIVGESTIASGLQQMTWLRKLSIYKLRIQKDGATFKNLLSSIEHLGNFSLRTLTINDEGSDFINSLDTMTAPPTYLFGLELSGKLERLPKWINTLDVLNKLTLSVTVLRTDTLELLHYLSSLFSLTFSLSAAKQDQDIKDILEKNKLQSNGDILVPGGFRSLQLLRFFAPHVPKLRFSDNAMPRLEMIEMRFDAFEGIFGIDTLKNLKEVHIRVNNQADETTKSLVDELKNTGEGLKVIVDHVFTA